MELGTADLKETLLKPFSIKKCLKCKAERYVTDIKSDPGTLYLFVYCKECDETLKVSLEIKWIEEVR